MRPRQIIIIGFMASGKTTVAEKLGRQLQVPALDLDSLITERQRRTPQEIIDADGERAFRRIESELLREALTDPTTGVIAAGGGAWTVAENRELVRAHQAFVVWLDAPFELCWQRIERDGQQRPLARTRQQAQALFAARRPLYELVAARVPVHENETLAELVARVARAVSPPDDSPH